MSAETPPESKHLFGTDFCYTPEALALDYELGPSVRLIFEKWLAKGYSPREIAHAAIWTIMDEEVSQVLELESQGVKK